MDKLLYMSTGLPGEEVERLRKQQTDFSSNAILPLSIFHGNIIAGLSKKYDEVTALSGVPVGGNYNIVRYPGLRTKKGNVNHIAPAFLNVPVVKQLTTILKLWWHVLTWASKNKNHNRNIIIDGTFYTGLISLWLAKKVVKINTMAIIVDMYPFMEPSRERSVQKIYYRLLKGVDSFAFVTEYLQELVNVDHKKYMIMEGLVDSEVTYEQADLDIQDYCLYAGGLHEHYGVKNLVDAFHESDIKCSLHLYGNGTMLDYIQELTKKDERIQYKGLVSHEQLLQLESKAKLLVNPRPVYGKLDTRYNFPSKLMEFMQSGRPVITTKLLGIPKDYDSYMFYFEDDTKESIKKGLGNVLALNEESLREFGRNAQKYVNENKNNVVIAERIFRMINSKGINND